MDARLTALALPVLVIACSSPRPAGAPATQPQAQAQAQSRAGGACERLPAFSELDDFELHAYPCGVTCGGSPDLLCRQSDDEEQLARDDEKHYLFSWLTFLAMLGPGTGTGTWAQWRPLDQGPSAVALGDTCEMPTDEELEVFVSPAWAEHESKRFDARRPPGHNPIVPQRRDRRIHYENRVNHRAGEHLDKLAFAGAQRDAALLAAAQNQAWGYYAAVPSLPAIHSKTVWIDIDEDERDAFITHPEDPGRGLIALHLALNLRSSKPVWVWATFEHRRLLADGPDGPALLRDNGCGADCPLENQCPGDGQATQIARAQPLDPALLDFDARIQEFLAGRELALPFENYLLVGVQRPLFDARAEIQAVRPELLASVVVEWDRQERSSCIGCHSHATIAAPSPAGYERICADCEVAPGCRPTWFSGDGPRLCTVNDLGGVERPAPDSFSWLPQSHTFYDLPAADMFWGLERLATPP